MSLLLLVLACTPVESADTAGPAGVPLPRDEVEGQPTGEDPMGWLEPHWATTVEICQPPDPFVTEYVYIGRSFMSDECVARVGADLGIPEDQLDDYYLTNELLSSAFFLMGYPQSTVEELLARTDDEGAHYVREPFRTMVAEIADELGHDQVADVLYDMVASVIVSSSVEELEGSDASYNLGTRSLTFDLDFSETGIIGAAILVHEAAHGWTGVRHVECPDGTIVASTDWSGIRQCDDDWGGAYGMQAASLLLLQESIPEEEDAQTAEWYWWDAEAYLGYAEDFILLD